MKTRADRLSHDGQRQATPPNLTNEERSALVRELMVRCGVKLTEAEFIRQVSNSLHEIEAPIYDERHPELTSQVPRAMEEFLEVVLSSLNGRLIRVLDLGCGTGYASTLILEKMGGQISHLVCSDISPHMLELCKKRLGGRPEISFMLGDADAVASRFSAFDLVITCSVVHHIHNVSGFLLTLGELVAPGGFYLMMHEPSNRFYRNPPCIDLVDRFTRTLRLRRLIRFIDPRAYYRRLKKWLGVYRPPLSIELQTTQLLMKRGIVQSLLTEREVRQLVDVHVPAIHSGSFMVGHEGLDVEQLSGWLQDFRLTEARSYGFLGPYVVDGLSLRWRRQVDQLVAKYPDDGAQFCILWHKPTESLDRQWASPGGAFYES